ncbi:MAG: tRNA (adenosine(37)-N6)-threonylcarbamoyltransferase complex dimerization subunit type 1 TsaB [Chthoniobacterales bacterium]
MKILALELSSPEGSIAWRDEDEAPFLVRFPNDRKHSGVFFENLQSCLKRFGNPQWVVVGLGPGSYAGTRIAIACASGLVAACGAQLTGLTSLGAMEVEASEYAVIGDARRQSFFFARVRERLCVEGPLLFPEAEMGERLRGLTCPLVTTQPLPLAPDAIIAQPSALILAQISAETSDLVTENPLEPIYLREPHITFPKR